VEAVSHIVQEPLGQYFSFNDEIVDALIENDDARPQDGEEPFFSNDINYVSTGLRPYHLRGWWDSVEEDLKHHTRLSANGTDLKLASEALNPELLVQRAQV
jgi:hypothetical protein